MRIIEPWSYILLVLACYGLGTLAVQLSTLTIRFLFDRKAKKP